MFNYSDGIVAENIVNQFYNEISNPQVRCFYAFQIMIEQVHSEVYSLLIDTLVKDPGEKMKLFHAIDEYPCIKRKAEWSLKYMEKVNKHGEIVPLGARLVAYACVEGIFFSSSFAAIFYFKKRNKMHGLGFSNELISRDEALHCDFSCLVYNKLEDKISQDLIHEIVWQAVECELDFVEECLKSDLIGINSKMMGDYVRFCADRLLVELNVEKMYNVTNPFEWMDLISLQGKTNFFERRVGEYAMAGVGVEKEDMVFDLDADF